MASKEIEAYLEQKTTRNEFKEMLSETLEVLNGDGLQLPLIIFVDDLDRCRPTFSVELLESIKHIFNVKNVVFVIAVDANQLAESVKFVYGSGMDGNAYLKKILPHQYDLPNLRYDSFSALLFQRMNITDNKVFLYDHFTPVRFFSTFAESFKLSLRDQEQIFEKLMYQ